MPLQIDRNIPLPCWEAASRLLDHGDAWLAHHATRALSPQTGPSRTRAPAPPSDRGGGDARGYRVEVGGLHQVGSGLLATLVWHPTISDVPTLEVDLWVAPAADGRCRLRLHTHDVTRTSSAALGTDGGICHDLAHAFTEVLARLASLLTEPAWLRVP